MRLNIAIFLAIIQGMTEFIPISSSGHLVLFQKLLNFQKPPVLFDILLHIGTLISIIIFFKKKFFSLIKEKNKKLIAFLFTGTLPAAFLGLIMNNKTEHFFNSLEFLGHMWVINGCILIFSDFLNSFKLHREIEEVNAKDAILIGIFQALAIFPGISRSGTTITAGLLRKFTPESSFFLSFFLSIPTILGALILEARKRGLDDVSLEVSIFSLVVAGIVGYLSLKTLQNILKSRRMTFLGIYCLVLGILVLVKI